MSLINQMLQALEQRPDRPPEASSAVRVAAPPTSGGQSRWLSLGSALLLLLAFAAGWLLRRETPEPAAPQAVAQSAEMKTVTPVPLPDPVAVVSHPGQAGINNSATDQSAASVNGSSTQRGTAEGEGVTGGGESNKVAEAASDHPHPTVQAGRSLSGPLRAAAPCNPAVLPDCPPQREGAKTSPPGPLSQSNATDETKASGITSLPLRGRTGGGESNKAAATDPEAVGKTATETSLPFPAKDKPSIAASRTAAVATAPKPPLGGAEATAQLKQTTPRQRAEQAYQQALVFQKESRDAEAIGALHRTLQLEPEHAAARQSLAVQLAESGEAATAEALLTEGMELEPGHAGLSMSLARLMVERGEEAGALELLDRQGDTAHAGGEYQALYAALLQRAGRHTDALERYQLALGANPASAPNWAGLGISLRATGQTDAARESFQRALQAGGLDPALENFVRENLRELRGEGSE